MARYAELKIALTLTVLGVLVLVVVGVVLPAMPAWKWFQLIGLKMASLGAAIIVFTSGVPWVLPNRPRYREDVWLWKSAFALMVVGMVLQLIGTVLSP
jgi:predicted nucleic acid-binding Zn ribbon protein